MFSSCFQDLDLYRLSRMILHDAQNPFRGLIVVIILWFNGLHNFCEIIFNSRGNILCRVKIVVASLILPSFGLSLYLFTKLILLSLAKYTILCFDVVSKGKSTGSVDFLGSRG